MATVGHRSRCTGQEITYAYVNAVLRDWARLGLMLANRGSLFGRIVVPEDWLTASTSNSVPTVFSPLERYGYHFWLSGDTKRLSLRGLRGQFVLVDPDIKLVLVQTALDGSSTGFAELLSLWSAVRDRLR